MNIQYLQYVREQLMVATADLSGATKGQLVAFAENAMFTATPRSRSRVKVINPANGKLVNPSSPPIPGQQSRAKGSHIPLVKPIEFSTSSWRRAVLSLEEHQKAWLLWCYAENIPAECESTILLYAWREYRSLPSEKRVADKTVQRMKGFILMAAADTKNKIHGVDEVSQINLAEVMGVSRSTWSKVYQPHWLKFKAIFERVDNDALCSITRSRSQQKAANSH
ncbi:antiterminator [Leclercia adecarboxylata]|uniref:bacteriophage antitermination protein Q n=1 Tax=Leclercia adecarboxylata TaxID=83655 RepID=UPI00124646C2|nr:bacteriophage antitermination protein Q [Leclercia adecarboxylata]QEY55133.1 antiterminator [Leclercia adecarboxylata]